MPRAIRNLKPAIGIPLFAILCHVCFAQANNPHQGRPWNIQMTDPNRAGKFLNIPIYYGDWVPISNAKSIVESVASKIEAVNGKVRGQGHDHQRVAKAPEVTNPVVQESQPIDRVEVEADDLVYVDTISHNKNTNKHKQLSRERNFQGRPAVTSNKKNLGNLQRPKWPQRPASQASNKRRPPPYRRNDQYGRGTAAGSRRNRKLAPPNPFLSQLTSFFGGKQEERPLVKQKQQQRPQLITNPLPVPTAANHLNFQPSKPQPLPTDAVPSLHVGQIYPVNNPARPATLPTQSNPISVVGQKIPGPVIKLLPAPDLSEGGPPVIELGGGEGHNYQSEVIVGQRADDHLSGFVPINFEQDTSGRKEFNRHPNLSKPKDFSVAVSGVDNTPGIDELAHLLKDGKMNSEDHKAFIVPEDGSIPDGYHKVNLPYMEHAQEKKELPSVFIAPVGFKVPKGYKGHPLPYDPAVSGVTVVHTTASTLSTDATKETSFVTKSDDENSDSQEPASIVKNKLKLAKNRPSLLDFYRTKARKDGKDSKKRKILTKIVRRPLKSKLKQKLKLGLRKNTEDNLDNPFIREDTSSTLAVDYSTPVSPSTPISSTISTVSTSTTDPFEQVSEEIHSSTNVNNIVETTSESLFDSTSIKPGQEEVVIYDITEAVVLEESPDVNNYFEPTTAQQTNLEDPAATSTSTTASTTTSSVATDESLFDHVIPSKLPQEATVILTSTSGNEGDENIATLTDPEFPVVTSEKQTTPEELVVGPTPFSNLRPIRKLDSLLFRKPLKKYPAVQIEEVPSVIENVQEVTEKSQEENSYRPFAPNRFFGDRIKSRKRQPYWAQKYKDDINGRPSSTRIITEKPSKTEEYKQKFRPFFDQLYDKLVKSDKVTKSPAKRPWARRSTTTPNPYTINAEIYEVHPNLSNRVRDSTTVPNLSIFDSAPSEGQQELHNAEYQVKEQSSSTTESHPKAPKLLNIHLPTPLVTEHLEAVEQDPSLFSAHAEPIQNDPSAIPENLQSEQIVPSTLPERLEKVDIDSTIAPGPHQPVESDQTLLADVLNPAENEQSLIPVVQDQPLVPTPGVSETLYNYPEAPLNYDYVQNDIVDSEVTLDYGESQKVQTAWGGNDVTDSVKPQEEVIPTQDSTVNQQEYQGWHDIQVLPSDGTTTATLANNVRRLDVYTKGISPSPHLVDESNVDFTNQEPLINEHSKPQTTDEIQITPDETEILPDETSSEDYSQIVRTSPTYVNIQKDTTVIPIESEQILFETRAPDTISSVDEHHFINDYQDQTTPEEVELADEVTTDDQHAQVNVEPLTDKSVSPTELPVVQSPFKVDDAIANEQGETEIQPENNYSPEIEEVAEEVDNDYENVQDVNGEQFVENVLFENNPENVEEIYNEEIEPNSERAEEVVDNKVAVEEEILNQDENQRYTEEEIYAEEQTEEEAIPEAEIPVNSKTLTDSNSEKEEILEVDTSVDATVPISKGIESQYILEERVDSEPLDFEEPIHETTNVPFLPTGGVSQVTEVKDGVDTTEEALVLDEHKEVQQHEPVVNDNVQNVDEATQHSIETSSAPSLPTTSPTTAVPNGGLFKSLGLASLVNFFLPSTTRRPTIPTQITTDSTTVSTTSDSNILLPLATTVEVEQEEVSTAISETSTEKSNELDSERSAHPKSINTDKLLIPSLNQPSWLEKEEQTLSHQFLPEELDNAVKKREKVIKNWVARKYKGDKKVKDRFVNGPTAVPSKNDLSETTVDPTADNEQLNELKSNANDIVHFPFAPTIPPKGKKYPEKLAKTGDRQKSFLEKLRKPSLKKKKPIVKKKENKIPKGSNPNIFKKWEGGSLSQAEFERTVLGVSTATEVSVKSMICVRGRCYNADDMSTLIN